MKNNLEIFTYSEQIPSSILPRSQRPRWERKTNFCWTLIWHLSRTRYGSSFFIKKNRMMKRSFIKNSNDWMTQRECPAFVYITSPYTLLRRRGSRLLSSPNHHCYTRSFKLTYKEPQFEIIFI